MEDVAEVKANLIIAIQTNDLITFSSTLEKLKIPLNEVFDSQGYTIFHDLSPCMIPESDLLGFFTVLENYKFCDSEALRQYLNMQTFTDRQTALHVAVKYNRRVRVK
jgi:hypothetical protein